MAILFLNYYKYDHTATCRAARFARFARSCTECTCCLPTHAHSRDCLPVTCCPPSNAPPSTYPTSWGVDQGYTWHRAAAIKTQRISYATTIGRAFRTSDLALPKTNRSHPRTTFAFTDQLLTPIKPRLMRVRLKRNRDAIDPPP